VPIVLNGRLNSYSWGENMENQLHTLYVTGATATGKTAFADRLATLIPAEIVNMDIGQCYTPLSIGTAKPMLTATTVPHHLFNIFDTPRSLTVVEYGTMLRATIAAIHARGNHALIVGGSAFYLTSLFFPPQQSPTTKGVEMMIDDDEPDLWQQLHHIDSQRAADIQPNDTYRLKRALAIWHATGTKPSLCRPRFAPLITPWHIVYCVRDRDDLYARINTRVIEMVTNGWIDEVESIKDSPWEALVRDKHIIGYPELLDYKKGADGRLLQEVIAAIAQKTRHYAKRQITFFRRLQRLLHQEKSEHTIHEFNLTHGDFDLYIKQLLHRLHQ
jgi:tRNA dimethylallyltransferase